MKLKALFASGYLLTLGLVGQSALAGPRYYTCGYNGPVTTQDRCPDGTTPFLHLGEPPGPKPNPGPSPERTRQADLCDSTSDPYTCKWKRFKAYKCMENPGYYYCSNLGLTPEQLRAIGNQTDALMNQFRVYRNGMYYPR
jgi:hypothetical protein